MSRGALSLILIVIAFICFVLASFNWTPHPRINFLAIGLALWSLALIIPELT